MLRNVLLVGVEVDSEYVLWLATELIAAGHNDIAATLLYADSGGGNVALTVVMREVLLRILDDPPERLAELRTVLLQEHVGRKRDWLV